jgi:ABC-type proline/glycine betaine transport system permease subunit
MHTQPQTVPAANTRWLVKSAAVITGFVIIALAFISWYSAMPPVAMFAWLQKMFGAAFVFAYGALVLTAVLAIARIQQGSTANSNKYWHELAQHASSGVATLALTFTLLGISLGIGSLAEQELSPDTVNEIIGNLTQHFATAFMTTVVGLPSAALLRAWASLRYIRQQN